MTVIGRNLSCLIIVVCCTLSTASLAQSSVCYGETHNGRLENGVQIIADPARYYCEVCVALGRVYAHAPVAEAVTAAYQVVAPNFPETDFVLGEVGWRQGGRFEPHRTHQNGLSVDFMVPLKAGAVLPTSPATRYGYDLDFDDNGTGPAGDIDFEAIAAHLDALETQARTRGGHIRRIFLAPRLSARLPEQTQSSFRFNTQEAWVRHDDHYHVDFSFPCTKLNDD